MDILKEKKLNYALYHTHNAILEKGGTSQNALEQASFALSKFILTGNADAFTRTNDARNDIKNQFTSIELADYISEYMVQLSDIKVSDTEEEKKLYYEIMIRKMNGKDDRFIIQEIEKALLGLQDKALSFTSFELMSICTQIYSSVQIKQLQSQKTEVLKNVMQELPQRYGVRNLRYNSAAVNYCREEVLNGTQIKIQNDIKAQNTSQRPRREYDLGDDMYAVTDIGQRRKEQQDSVLILRHPKNPKYKMLIVADGMGGSTNGQMASMEIVKQMISWFEKLSTSYMHDYKSKQLMIEWEDKINQINKDIIRKYPGSGSTFVGAIVGETTTTIGYIGDSRAYVLGKDNELYQWSSDDNYMYQEWKDGWDKYEKSKGRLTLSEIKEKEVQKDYLRFHVNSNKITDCLGSSNKKDISLIFSQIPNRDYKTLMLFSDGVTDCLSDSQIMAITRSTKSKDLARAIVDMALTTDSYRKELEKYPEYNTHIIAGKDNTSAVVFDKRQGDER